MRGLTIFEKTSSKTRWNIAAYHDPLSLTWSWVLAFDRFQADEARIFPLCWRLPHGQEKWGFRIPFVGMITWMAQEKMMRDTLVQS